MLGLAYADEGAQGTFDLRAWKMDDGFEVTWRDVRDREEALVALRAGEERFRTSIEHLHEALSVFDAANDADGNISDFRWTYANAAASAITGYLPSELEGRLLLEVLPVPCLHSQRGIWSSARPTHGCEKPVRRGRGFPE